jgi:hypothetical protein
MGNYDIRAVNFLQSPLDFPLMVSLGKKSPSFGLSRFKKGLKFVPPDDESFSLRGDRRQLLYKGRRRSHRFTILGDCSFEYDCILLREPESNVITLRMEGAENYDFFRQPDFLKEPLLAGSYAVYKKDTVVGEGTGKLCHIHRPEIIDARGRRCWGDLSVVGNELHITIPEKWLGEASYPVIVDPTIGTTTVGSLTYNDEEEGTLLFDVLIAVNRFWVNEAVNGLCTAYVYTDADDKYAGGRPVLYSDFGNVPQTRRSKEEQFIDLRVVSGKPKGWRTGTFRNNTDITSGIYIWFGVFTEYTWLPRFDWGTKCYTYSWEEYDSIPNTYPMYDVNWYYDFRLSMYFTYTLAQNYVRTLTQGIKLTDNRILKGSYKRYAIQTVKVNSALGKFETFFRKCVITLQNSVMVNRVPLFFRNILEQVNVTFSKNEKMSLERKCIDEVIVNSNTDRIHNVIRFIQESLKILDTQTFSVLFVRSVNDTPIVTDYLNKIGSFIRGLHLSVGSVAETVHKAEYYRFNSDTVQTEGIAYKGLLLFVRIVTQVFIRDYLLRRFLKAREELILKSAICREIILESRID